MRGKLLSLLVVTLALAGCCGPDQCAPARQAFRHLDPVVDHLRAFHEREGRYPARLEDAYPEGFPPGLENKTGADYAEIETLNSGRYRAPLLLGGSLYAFKERSGRSVIFGYAKAADQYSSDSEKRRELVGQVVLSFEYSGPGVNSCFWNSATLAWTCGGYI